MNTAALETILQKYGNPPRYGDYNHDAVNKILHCVTVMDSKIERMQRVVEAARELTGGWDYDHEGWKADRWELKNLQDKVNALENTDVQ